MADELVIKPGTTIRYVQPGIEYTNLDGEVVAHAIQGQHVTVRYPSRDEDTPGEVVVEINKTDG